MRKLCIVCSFLLPLSTIAQDNVLSEARKATTTTVKKDVTDTTGKLWTKGGQISVNLTQGSLNNWSAGGDDFSFSVNSLINLFAYYKKGRNTWDNNFDFNLGFVNTTTGGDRKNDDRIDITSKYGYELKKNVSLAVLANLRTQTFDGFAYGANNAKTFTSTFFAPAYITNSVGIDWKPIDGLSIFFSPITSRLVVVNDIRLYSVGAFGVTPGKKTNQELGAYAVINYTKALTKTISYKGKLELFSNYKRNPQNVDVFMTNLFTVKLSKILSATWNVDLIYDDDVRQFGPNKTSPGLQRKSLIGAGLLIKL